MQTRQKTRYKDFGQSARVAALTKEERVAYEDSLKAYRGNYAMPPMPNKKITGTEVAY